MNKTLVKKKKIDSLKEIMVLSFSGIGPTSLSYYNFSVSQRSLVSWHLHTVEIAIFCSNY